MTALGGSQASLPPIPRPINRWFTAVDQSSRPVSKRTCPAGPNTVVPEARLRQYGRRACARGRPVPAEDFDPRACAMSCSSRIAIADEQRLGWNLSPWRPGPSSYNRVWFTRSARGLFFAASYPLFQQWPAL